MGLPMKGMSFTPRETVSIGYQKHIPEGTWDEHDSNTEPIMPLVWGGDAQGGMK